MSLMSTLYDANEAEIRERSVHRIMAARMANRKDELTRRKRRLVPPSS